MADGRTREDLLRFLDYLGNKGLLAKATAASRKAAANKVLGILDSSEAQDVTTIDVDAVIHRFGNLYRQKYTPQSLQTYKSRVHSALDDFRSHLENPLAFKPSLQTRSKPRIASDKTETEEKKAVLTGAGPTHRGQSPGVNILPIPLRPNLVVQIAGLPFDLTTNEARKIANIVLAHAADSEA
jgi:hypothetical protein